MNLQQTKGFIKTIGNMFIDNNKKLDIVEVREQYSKVLVNYEELIAQKAIDNLIMTTKYLPSIPELIEMLRNVEKLQRVTRVESNICLVCLGEGFILHNSYPLYCTECDKGKEYMYNGQDNGTDKAGKPSNNPKSDYYIEPVTKYYDIQELKGQNAYRNERRVVPMPDNVRKLLKKCARKMGA